LLASFDTFRIFGQSVPLSAETDWRAVRDRSIEALRTSKDLRILAHLGSAVVRTEGLDRFAEVVGTASKWLETWWDRVFPRVDDDAILRRNALNGFGDRMAIVDGVRRAPLLAHRQLGSLSIRDVEIATGQMARPDGDGQADASQLNAMLTATPVEELQRVCHVLEDCTGSLKSIETIMRDRGGTQAAPDFATLTAPLLRTAVLIKTHVGTRMPAAESANAGNGAAESGPIVAGAPGVIRSREDAVRALDAVAAFFRASEPSSPVPLFIERAKRLVAKDFLSVLEDIAPDALAQAKAVGGVRDQD